MSNGLKAKIIRPIRCALWATALMVAAHSYGNETTTPAESAATTEQPEVAPPEATSTEPSDTEQEQDQNQDVQPAADDGAETGEAADVSPESGELELPEPEPSTASLHSNRTSLLIGIAVLLVVLAVLIRLVGRNRNRSGLTTEAGQGAGDGSAASPLGYFQITETGQQRIYTLTGETIRVGRSDGNDLVLNDDTVSANHLVVKRERNGGILVTDLNSSNGTRINGEDITQATLVSGDTLELGNVMIRFDTRSPTHPANGAVQTG